MIPYGRQNISEEDIKSVIDVLRSPWLTQGPLISEFEGAISQYCGNKYSVAVCNGTVALHLACVALDLKEGDTLWTSPNSFVASANCALYCGADVDFIDIDATLNIDVSKLEERLRLAKKAGKLPRILVSVHFGGLSCHQKEIWKLSQEYGFFIIEDASHALGGSYLKSKVGSCEYSHMSTLSFHPVKSITTAEGGMVTTNDKALYDRMMLLRTHGITRNPDLFSSPSPGEWYYEQLELGYNYRLSDIHAVLGLSQLKRLDTFIKNRTEIAQTYTTELASLPLKFQALYSDAQSAWHLFVIRVNKENSGRTATDVFKFLREKQIGVNKHYIPIHMQPYYKKLGFKKGDFPEAEKYYDEAISLPIYPDLSQKDQDYTIEQIQKALS